MKKPPLEAIRLFDEITGASYYGPAFRACLASDPEAMKAAQKLVERLEAHNVPGTSKQPRPA